MSCSIVPPYLSYAHQVHQLLVDVAGDVLPKLLMKGPSLERIEVSPIRIYEAQPTHLDGAPTKHWLMIIRLQRFCFSQKAECLQRFSEEHHVIITFFWTMGFWKFDVGDSVNPCYMECFDCASCEPIRDSESTTTLWKIARYLNLLNHYLGKNADNGVTLSFNNLQHLKPFPKISSFYQ